MECFLLYELKYKIKMALSTSKTTRSIWRKIGLPNHRFRKNIVLIGGSGDLGRQITDRFTRPLLYKWNVYNIDFVENPMANENFVLTQYEDPETKT